MAALSAEYTRIHWDQEELERIKTIMARTGLKMTTEIVRNAVMEKYLNVTGSPNPNNGKQQ